MTRFKTVVKRITPPLLLNLYRHLRYPPTWKGVYSHITAVPATTDSASRNSGWLGSAVDPAGYDHLPVEVRQEHDFLALVAAVVCHENRGRLRVVDFGGGLGLSYVHLLKTIGGCSDVEYHIVELDWACAEGSRVFAHDPHIRFHRSLPNRWPYIDILHIKIALEYVEDYAATLRTLCSYRARYVLLVDLHAGVFPTYATAQLNVPGVVFAHWCLNLDEIVNIVETSGYRLIFKGSLYERADQRGFPPELQLPHGRSSVLLFTGTHS